jgi:Type I phosphodiesterase / nucleotide pyrophosphatase
MIDEKSIRAVDASRGSNGLVKPLYDSYCFSQIPRLIRSLFDVGSRSDAGVSDAHEERLDLANTPLRSGPLSDTYETVILLFIDAFGWRFVQEYQERYPFLRRFFRDGQVTKLTSQFPSSTTSHTTTIHTGLEVGNSSMYEWYIYEPALNAVIAPLLFSFQDDDLRNTLKQARVDPASIYPQGTLYESLAERGISSFILQSNSFTPSPFSDVVCRGANVLGFSSLERGLADLVRVARERTGRNYYFLYSGDIDSAGHQHGTDSKEFRAQADRCFSVLESMLYEQLAGKLANAILLMTADHGQIDIDPHRTLYLKEIMPELEGRLEIDYRGRPLVSGYSRDVFLHVRHELVEETQRRLADRLAGTADVHLTRDLIDQGFFGSGLPSSAFTSRAGNIVILPGRDELVWFDRAHPLKEFRGYHGGCTPEEMETELLALAL